MRRKILLLFIILTVMLVGCSPSEEAIQQAIEETAAARPEATMAATEEATAMAEPSPTAALLPTAEATATAEATGTSEPTAVAWGEIDLGPLLIVEGDLPDFLDGDFINDELRFDREEITRPDGYVRQDFYDKEHDRPGGGVMVYLYEDAGEASRAYGAISAGMTGLGGMFSEFRDDVGERARMENLGNDNLHLAFLRCHAFVEVFMLTPREFDVVNYGQRLDGRLGEAVCAAGE